MARYKYIDTHPRLLAVDLSRQLLPGTFEHAPQTSVRLSNRGILLQGPSQDAASEQREQGRHP